MHKSIAVEFGRRLGRNDRGAHAAFGEPLAQQHADHGRGRLLDLQLGSHVRTAQAAQFGALDQPEQSVSRVDRHESGQSEVVAFDLVFWHLERARHRQIRGPAHLPQSQQHIYRQGKDSRASRPGAHHFSVRDRVRPREDAQSQAHVDYQRQPQLCMQFLIAYAHFYCCCCCFLNLCIFFTSLFSSNLS